MNTRIANQNFQRISRRRVLFKSNIYILFYFLKNTQQLNLSVKKHKKPRNVHHNIDFLILINLQIKINDLGFHDLNLVIILHLLNFLLHPLLRLPNLHHPHQTLLPLLLHPLRILDIQGFLKRQNL